ncbi:MAG: hypothetical protein ACYC5G_00480 [Candidatus Doudnabacteria bacterium]
MMTTATPLVADVPRLMTSLRQQWQVMVTTRDMAEFDKAKHHLIAFLLELEMSFETAYKDHLKDHVDPHNGDRVFQFLTRFID